TKQSTLARPMNPSFRRGANLLFATKFQRLAQAFQVHAHSRRSLKMGGGCISAKGAPRTAATCQLAQILRRSKDTKKNWSTAKNASWRRSRICASRSNGRQNSPRNMLKKKPGQRKPIRPNQNSWQA